MELSRANQVHSSHSAAFGRIGKKTAIPAGLVSPQDDDAYQQAVLDEIRKLSPPSNRETVWIGASRKLNLRQWWLPGEKKPKDRDSISKWRFWEKKSHPVVLLIHGLAKSSDYTAPLAEEMMKCHGTKNTRYYSLDLESMGCQTGKPIDIDPAGFQELVGQIQDAIHVLGERHGGKVEAIGVSLGGLLLANAAVKNPPGNRLNKIALISPAFGPRGITLSAIKDFFRRCRKPMTDEDVVSRYGKMSPLQTALRKAQTRVIKVTKSTYLTIWKAMRQFQAQLAPKMPVLSHTFATNNDEMVGIVPIINAHHKFPTIGKQLTVFKRAPHNLVLDWLNKPMAQDISHFFFGDGTRPNYGEEVVTTGVQVVGRPQKASSGTYGMQGKGKRLS